MLFYFTLCALFSLVYSVVGVSNMEIVENNAFRDAMLGEEGYVGVEYRRIGKALGNFLDIIKASTADFGFIGGTEYLTYNENILFWVSYTLISVVCTIIFLNFVISEASASYEAVNTNLQKIIYQSQCKLVSEAELMIPYITRNEKDFPKYVIEREVDS